MPTSLRERTLKLAHEGHQGIVKTKHLLRQKVWWPGIDTAIGQQIQTCITCQAQGPVSTPPPLEAATWQAHRQETKELKGFGEMFGCMFVIFFTTHSSPWKLKASKQQGFN